MNISPAIKWSGSKRSQAKRILEYFPKEIDTYYEPFCGGCSVLAQLLVSKEIKVKRFVVSDLNDDLIALWKLIQSGDTSVIGHYESLWNDFSKIVDWNEKKEFYYRVRSRFNSEKSPLDFMFIMRTCYNGLSRYNRSGNFNSPLHPTRNGINPSKLKEILLFWHKILSENNVEFICQSYENVLGGGDDFLYLDPPYAATTGMYFGTLDYNVFWYWLRKQNCGCVLSFDGKTTSNDCTVEIPKDLYREHLFLDSGNSAFRRLNKTSNKEYVYESLYIK